MASWTIGTDDAVRVFQEQNPWHESGTVPSALAPPVERPLARALWRRLLRDDPLRYQLILGPRRVGKTTVLYQTVRRLLANGIEPDRVWWLRMDHPVYQQASLDDLIRVAVSVAEATPERPAYVMLDELVYARDWDLWLKTFHDDRWPVRIAATSSATAALKQRRLESGIGRWAEQRLMPYLFDEFLELVGEPAPLVPQTTLAATLRTLDPGTHGNPQVAERRRAFLLTGGFPELIAPHRQRRPEAADGKLDIEGLLLDSQRILRDDAVERAIYKDIPQSFGRIDTMSLERLLYILAGQVARVVSPTKLATSLGIRQPTVGRYLSYLERTFLVFALPNYAGSEAKVQRRGRKIYFVDGAIRNAALQRGLAPLGDPTEMGLLLENLAVTTMHTLAVHSGIRLHHWRDGKREVDLIFNDPRQPLAFEIGASARHSRAGLAALIERHGRFRGNSYLVAPQASVQHAEAADSGIGTLPLDRFLVAVGAQARKALLDRLG